MNKFIVGNHYAMFYPCQHSCVWKCTVVKRTDKTILLANDDDRIKRCKIMKDNVGEYCYPIGRFSMCPVLRATEEE